MIKKFKEYIKESNDSVDNSFYYPSEVKPEDKVKVQHIGTLTSDELVDSLLKEMQRIGREDLSAEQIENLVDNLYNQNLTPWDLYNKLVAYVDPFRRREFKKFYENEFKKHYISLSSIIKSIPESSVADEITDIIASNMGNYLGMIIDKTDDEDIKEHGSMLGRQMNTAGGSHLMKDEVVNFVYKHKDLIPELVSKFRNVKIDDITE